MPGRVSCGTLIGLWVVAALPAARAADLIEPTGEAAMAWRFDAISSATLGPDKPEPVWRQCIALLEAASRLNPSEPRFFRLRTLALSHIGDVPGAIAALREYRKLAPADRIAQLELIDLYASKMETLDARVGYFNSLLDKQDIPTEVRAALAVKLATLLSQKSPDLAAKMAEKAVGLYPLAQATRLYYRYVGRQETDLAKRVAALLTVIKSDPNQPTYLEELATVLAGNGLADASLQWYDLAVYTMFRGGGPLPSESHNLVIDYASEAVVAGRLAFADTMVGQLLEQEPLDADAWFLKLTTAKATSPQLYPQQVEMAGGAFIRRWNALHDQVLTGQAAPLAPEPPKTPGDVDVKVEPLDPGPVIDKLKAGPDSPAREGAVSVISDLAWFYLYFDPKPDMAAKWIEALRPLLSADSISMRRLDGWHALLSGDAAKAWQILSTAADKDAISEFGLIRAEQSLGKPVEPARVTQLLANNRIGLVAAMLWAAVKTDANRPATQPAANDVLKELANFPAKFLAVLDPSAVNSVYNVQAEPVEINLSYGAPVLAKVTISNIGTTDITIGDDALLRRDLWFDGRTLGFDPQIMNGIAFDQIANQLVLRARESTTQIVRLDSAELRNVLAAAPGASTTVNAGVITNPIPIHDPGSKEQQMAAGPGGTASNFYSTFTYAGVSLVLPSGKKQIDDTLASNSVVDKMHTIDLLAAYDRLAQNPSADQALRTLAPNLPNTIGGLRQDKSPFVAAWASYVSASLPNGGDPQKIVSDMAASPDWTTRLLSLFAGDSVSREKRKELAASLANDSDATVKAAAAATVDLLDQSPPEAATQPADAAAGK